MRYIIVMCSELPTEEVKEVAMKLRGFTLAEVLITLGIIGVVAAMTIPMLIINYQKRLTLTRLKKTYSQLSQVIKIIDDEQGLAVLHTQPSTFVPKYILPHYNGATYYKPNSNHRQAMCFNPNHYYLSAKSNAAQYTSLSDTRKGYCSGYISTPFMPGHTASIELPDSTCIGFNYFTSTGIQIFVDINGSATPPNCFGKDLFFLEVDEDKTSVIPNKVWGMYDSSKKGAYKIIKDGWKFAKDYPW